MTRHDDMFRRGQEWVRSILNSGDPGPDVLVGPSTFHWLSGTGFPISEIGTYRVYQSRWAPEQRAFFGEWSDVREREESSFEGMDAYSDFRAEMIGRIMDSIADDRSLDLDPR